MHGASDADGLNVGPPMRTTLDHLDFITIPGNVFARPANEYAALLSLWTGMEFLYRQAHNCDAMARRSLNPNGTLRLFVSANSPDFTLIPTPLLTCAFHWYAISACQYVRTVGAIAYQFDATRPKPLDYTKQVLPEVLPFRDKVAAHFSWGTNNKNDNHAERFVSILPSLAFRSDSFYVNAFHVALTAADRSSTDSTALPAWSLCKVHERLRQRYWPTPAQADGSNATASVRD